MGAKEKKAKLQIIIFTLLLVLVGFAELYIMINTSNNYMLIITLLIMALIAVYVILDGAIVIFNEKNSRKEEQYDALLKSEKASYLMQKKTFEELQEQLAVLEENSKVPSEEIINAQKGIAKVIISRSKENADAIISSNDQVLERLDEIQTTHNQSLEDVLEKQKNANTESKNKMETKLQDIILNMKDMEIRLNQSISQNSKVVVSSAPQRRDTPVTDRVENMSVQNVEDVFEMVEDPMIEDDFIIPEEPIVENDFIMPEEPVVEDTFDVFEEPAMEETLDIPEEPVIDDIFDIFEESIKEESVKEELPPMPDLSDPNKAMNPDEIAALFANLAGGNSVNTVDTVEDDFSMDDISLPEEETPPMPDLSDPNKMMSPEDIAALIANL